jgi:hypothetical protein
MWAGLVSGIKLVSILLHRLLKPAMFAGGANLLAHTLAKRRLERHECVVMRYNMP